MRNLSMLPSTCTNPLDLDDVDSLVRTYRPRVLAYALGSLRDPDLAETVTQECFLRAFDTRHLFRGECSVYAWLVTIATNLIRDHTRTKRFRFWKMANGLSVDPREIASRVASPHRSPEVSLMAHEQLGIVLGIVRRLSRRQRTVFLLRFVEEMELEDIAVAAGISVGTVKSHLHRAVAAIRKQMGPRRWR